MSKLHRQLGVASRRPHSRAVYRLSDIRAHDRQVPRKTGNRAQKVPKQYHDAVQLDAEPDKRPLDEDERQSAKKCRRSFELLLPCKEGGRLLRANYNGEPDEEENLCEADGACQRGALHAGTRM